MKTILRNAITVSIILFLIPTANSAQGNALAQSSAAARTVVVSERMNIYPNPSCGNMTMQFRSTGADRYILNITDILGKLVFSDRIVAVIGINLYEIDFTKENRGIYILSLENSGVKEQKRFVVE